MEYGVRGCGFLCREIGVAEPVSPDDLIAARDAGGHAWDVPSGAELFEALREYGVIGFPRHRRRCAEHCRTTHKHNKKDPVPHRLVEGNSIRSETMYSTAQSALRPFLIDLYWRRARIDPCAEIIAPALAERRRGYGEPTRDYKQELRETAAGL